MKLNNFKTISLSIILILSFLIFLIKINHLSFVEAEQDQTSYIYWLQSLFNSNGFLPDTKQNLNFTNNLIISENTFLNSLLKPIYNSPINIFTIISLLFFGIGSLILSPTVENQIHISILANSYFYFFINILILF